MTVRTWALRPSELARLSDAARHRFEQRLAQRVRPWVPAAAEIEHGGAVWSALTEQDDVTARCANQALSTLVAIAGDDLLEACKQAASIAARRAHAGRTGEVDVVVPAFWELLRADLVACASDDPGPLWPDGEPDWSRPPPAEQALLDTYRSR
ncbi:hypothetical protein F0U44_09950 [Nocardioides humilatus]|uniref:Uncharacterized protein n=1 Tax=Nocardioides humilatus TaxID=2607660 RepID=A0A5B1LDT5_9ACTN|nr:hypothetical protein [Nocardioides humilatus]KAA1418802.1 hypothetical protein F0U44_09950 [Nocardioides humilatus]